MKNKPNNYLQNVIQHPQLIATGSDRFRTNYETTFVNLDGSRALNVNYSFSKHLAGRCYSLSLSGTVNYGYNVATSNNVQYHTTVWRVNQRFDPRIKPNDNV